MLPHNFRKTDLFTKARKHAGFSVFADGVETEKAGAIGGETVCAGSRVLSPPLALFGVGEIDARQVQGTLLRANALVRQLRARASEYYLGTLPDEQLLVAEIEKTRHLLETQRIIQGKHR